MQPYFGIDEGVADAYVVNTQQNQATYYSGMPVVFSTANTNVTATPTLNLNGIGARVIKNANGGALSAGEIKALTPITLSYSPVDNAWLMQSPLGYQRIITGAASTIVSSDLTAQRALISSPSGKVSASGITATELSYLFGVTSAIQSQIDARVRFDDFVYQGGIHNSTYSTDNNGYLILPNGFKIIWMEIRTFSSSAGNTLATLPYSFSTLACSWQVSSANGGGTPTAVGIGPNSTLSAVDVRWSNNTTGVFITAMGV